MPHLRPPSRCCALQKNCPAKGSSGDASGNSNPTAAADELRTRRERWFHGPPASFLIRNRCPCALSKNSILSGPSGGRSSIALPELDGDPGAPLLVIAGAGSGEANTLAHRVAHLIVNGADPRKILLMTFSRRAAAEMARRVEQITRGVIGRVEAQVLHGADALWAGTFQGSVRGSAGVRGQMARSCFHHSRPRGFGRLMNLMRHELGLSKTENRFPAKVTCLAVYSRCVNAELPIEGVLRASSRGVPSGRLN